MRLMGQARIDPAQLLKMLGEDRKDILLHVRWSSPICPGGFLGAVVHECRRGGPLYIRDVVKEARKSMRRFNNFCVHSGAARG
jgi:hypothetical protein